MTNATWLEQAEQVAIERANGHLTIYRWTTGWKAFFGTPEPDRDRQSIGAVPTSTTIEEACRQLVEHPIKL